MKPSVALQSWTGLFFFINEEHVVKMNDHLSVFFKVQPVYQENYAHVEVFCAV